jgi:hypothetical protein
MRTLIPCCLLIALVSSACGGPGGSTPLSSTPPNSPGQSQPLGPPADIATPAPSASATWPEVGSAPPLTTVGEMYLVYSYFNEISANPDLLVVTAKGLVVRAVDGPEGGPYAEVHVVRQLNDAGMSWLRRTIAETGLFAKSRTRPLLKPREAVGSSVKQISVTSAGKTVTVGQYGAPPDYYEPSAAWDRFNAITAGAIDPDRWVPAGDWADASWTGYHPAQYCLSLEWGGSAESDALDAGKIDWPSGVLPFSSFGTALESREPALRSGSVSSDDAYAMAASIRNLATKKGLQPDGYYKVMLRDGGPMDSPLISESPGSVPFTARLKPLHANRTVCQ